MQTLNRDKIIAAKDLETEQVEVPEWGGSVLVRTMNGTERDAFEASFYVGRGKNREQNLENLRARLVALVVVDEAGERVFTDEDTAALGQKSVKALDRIFEVAQRLNGIGPKDVEDLAGN